IPDDTTKINLKDSNILLVEDNLINQKIVLLSLKKAVKNVEIANNGKEALDKFGSAKFDIILMDIQMPIMNGIVTTKKIRNIEKSTNTHTPIIAITANALLGDKEECIAAGMDDYLSKPFQIETLLDKMKKQL
ncbi:MAG: response regulator, partial [Bacteroidota bacterium]|nr:response regulator [Bacteroidota bacterium]